MVRVAVLVLVLSGAAGADSSVSDPPVPACHDATWRGIERAFPDYCRAHKGGGVHGTCAEWLRSYRGCQSTVFERQASGWRVVMKLFDCHDPVLVTIPDGKRWRVSEMSMRSYLPSPRMPGLDLEASPSPEVEIK